MPLPDSPVIHSVTPFCPSVFARFASSARHSCPGLHSMMFDDTFLPSIFARCDDAASASDAAAGHAAADVAHGADCGGHSSLQSGHAGADGHSFDGGHSSLHPGHAGHVGHLEIASRTARCTIECVSGAAQVGQLGHAGQFDAAAFAMTDAFGHGESFGYSAAVHTTPAMNEANMLMRHRWSVRSR